jgi:hypothetical protein
MVAKIVPMPPPVQITDEDLEIAEDAVHCSCSMSCASSAAMPSASYFNPSPAAHDLIGSVRVIEEGDQSSPRSTAVGS